MTPRIDITGASGAVYSYTLVTELLRPVGGNYVIVSGEGEGMRVLYAGETDSLAGTDWRALLDEAQAEHGAARALFRLNVRRAVREREREDLVAQHRPPMNREPQARPPEGGACEPRQATG